MGPTGDGREMLRIAHRFEEQPDRCDPGVVEEGVDAVLGSDTGLIADGDDRAETQTALLEREVDRDVAALRDDGDAPFPRLHAVLVGPQGDTVECVDEAVAVRAEERQVAGGIEQIRLQIDLARLGKTRSVAHGTTGTDRSQRGHGLDRRVPVDPEENGIGNVG